jgi:catecholate siderophore receptor
LTVGGGTQFTGASRVSLNNTNAAELPEHWILNAIVSYELTKNISVRLNVTNVADEHYARAVNNNSNRAYFGDPRTYLVSAEFRF